MNGSERAELHGLVSAIESAHVAMTGTADPKMHSACEARIARAAARLDELRESVRARQPPPCWKLKGVAIPDWLA
ncbi:MAG TPA: hypothetical protein PLX89_14830 [Verrucomicrobiota bacterium]|nr:hypothetical protein [Verrucomicrobiales bacterium]HRI14266.1 hypothetical protein [Verrucomicrobiota bacterium]